MTGGRCRVRTSAVFLLGVTVALGSTPLGAQTTAGAQRTPLRPCCGFDAGSSPSRDTLARVARVVRNGAAMAAALPDDWSRVQVEIQHVAGALHRPQEAGALSTVALRAEGQRTARGWWSSGAAGYRRGRDHDVRWRNHAEPYTGMPYEWADSVGGTMRHDQLGLEGALATPRWRGWRAGLQLDYGIGQGARRNDPRPLFRRRVADLSPGLVYTRGGHELAAGALLGWHREDLEIGGGNSTEFPVLFRLRGIGTFDRTQLISGERAIIGQVRGGHAGYALHTVRWQAALGATLRIATDSVRDGIATPTNGGSARRVRQELAGQLRRHGAHPLELTLSNASETARGRDAIFAAVNAIDEARQTRVELRWWAGVSPVIAPWLLTASVIDGVLSRADRATETAWRVPRQRFAVHATYRGSRPTGGVMIESGIAAQTIGAASYSALRPTRLTPILAAADYAVVAAARTEWTAALGWEQRTASALLWRIRAEVHAAGAAAGNVAGRPALGRESVRVILEYF